MNNDDCAAAISVVDGTYALDTVCATTDGPDQPGPPPTGCQQFGLATDVHRDVWYEYVSDCTGTLTVSTCDSADFDTRIAVYDGEASCPPTAEDLIDCNDSIFGCLFTAEVNTPTMVGRPYLIRIGGPTPEASGTGTWTVTCTPACQVGLPINDPEILEDCGAPNCMDVGCDFELGCVFFQQPGGGPCDNGDPCFINDVCNDDGDCIDGTCDCTTIADCADTNGDGVRDDGCVWWACDDNVCINEAIVFADMGSQFGACPPDGAADGNDRFQALNCFANVEPGTPGAPFPCEDGAPAAFNVDTGGQFGSCAPDGVCDGNDAFAALSAFEGTTTCTCPLGGPAPVISPSETASETAVIRMRPSRDSIRPGELLHVDLFLDSPLKDLRGYQLHLGVDGGARGALTVADIALSGPWEGRVSRSTSKGREKVRRAHVWNDAPHWQAFNVDTRQLLVGRDTPGRAVSGGYLGTFTLRASQDATGIFVIDLLADPQDPMQRTFFFGTRPGLRVDVRSPSVRVVVE